jgi:hypothetical protein
LPSTALQYWMTSCSTALVCTLLINPIYLDRKVALCRPHG